MAFDDITNGHINFEHKWQMKEKVKYRVWDVVEFVSIHQVIQICVLLNQVICNCINTTHIKPGVKDVIVIVHVFYLLFHIVVTYGLRRVGVGSVALYGGHILVLTWGRQNSRSKPLYFHPETTVLCCGNGNILGCKPVLSLLVWEYPSIVDSSSSVEGRFSIQGKIELGVESRWRSVVLRFPPVPQFHESSSRLFINFPILLH